MRKLRHPITVFMMGVLVVIAIGVGVVVATTNQKVYGPFWGRFTVAFSGRLDVALSGPVTSASSNDPMRYTSTFYYANQPFNGWVAYAPLSNSLAQTSIVPPGLRAVVVTEVARDVPGSSSAKRLVADPPGGYLSVPGVSKDERVVNGLRVITLGPVCRDAHCDGELIVSNGRVAWDVLASNGSASNVESFLDSFQPIG